jgi:tripartite-type tricarboxylate transporter receptor subunit TctC
MSLKAWSLALAVGVGLTSPASGLAQEPFYQGKVVRTIVGVSPGGGYDTYARLIARHLGKHIAGHPTIIVENMPGAASRIAANHLYRVAKPDGLTIGHFLGGLFLQQLLEKPGIEFDARTFEYIGVPAQDHYTIVVSRATGIRSVEQWIASGTRIKLGGVGAGSPTDDIPKILVATLGLPIQLVSGYKGTADVRLAFQSGEVQGVCNAWESMKSTWRKELDSGDAIVVLQTTARAHPELPNVPLAISLAKTDEARKLIQAGVHTVPFTARPLALPPGTPAERVQMLRKAFMDTMRDPAFRAEAQGAKLDIDPADGAELARNVRELFNLDADLVAKLKEILK